MNALLEQDRRRFHYHMWGCMQWKSYIRTCFKCSNAWILVRSVKNVRHQTLNFMVLSKLNRNMCLAAYNRLAQEIRHSLPLFVLLLLLFLLLLRNSVVASPFFIYFFSHCFSHSIHRQTFDGDSSQINIPFTHTHTHARFEKYCNTFIPKHSAPFRIPKISNYITFSPAICQHSYVLNLEFRT